MTKGQVTCSGSCYIVQLLQIRWYLDSMRWGGGHIDIVALWILCSIRLAPLFAVLGRVLMKLGFISSLNPIKRKNEGQDSDLISIFQSVNSGGGELGQLVKWIKGFKSQTLSLSLSRRFKAPCLPLLKKSVREREREGEREGEREREREGEGERERDKK